MGVHAEHEMVTEGGDKVSIMTKEQILTIIQKILEIIDWIYHASMEN